MKNASLSVLLAIFISSGVIAPLLIQLITMNGGCEMTTLMIMLPNSIGMCLASLSKRSTFTHGTIQWRWIVLLALLEMFSQALILDGLMLAGSAIYTVTYSSVTIYTAILSYFLLDRRLQVTQWMGVVVVFIGLAVVSIGATSDGPDELLGVMLILTGSLSHACTYVGTEHLLIWTEDPVSPQLLCLLLGLLSTAMNLLWQLLYTYPRYSRLVTDQIALHNGSMRTVLLAYAGLTVMAGVHALVFYQLLGSIGSVSTGICKGVQSVAIFIGGHVAFCGVLASQCFSWVKGLSLVIVSLGVLLYSSDHMTSSSSAERIAVLHDESMLGGEGEGEARSFLLEYISPSHPQQMPLDQQQQQMTASGSMESIRLESTSRSPSASFFYYQAGERIV